MKRTSRSPFIAAIAAAVVLSAVPAAVASSTPVGPLPKGPVVLLTVKPKEQFTIVVKKRPAKTGLVWRIARAFNPKVVKQVGEGETATTVWLRFRGAGKGQTKIVLAVTKGETRKAFAAGFWVVTVR